MAGSHPSRTYCATEILIFDAPGTPGRATLNSPQIAVCGRCGAMLAPGYEVMHVAFHGVAFSTATMTVRWARGPSEANSP